MIHQALPSETAAAPATAQLSVGFVCSEYPTFKPAHGGIGSFVQTMARALVQRGHRATVYAFSTERDRTWDEGVRLTTIGPTGVLSGIRAMRSRLRRDVEAGLIQIVEAPECEAHCLPAGVPSAVRMQGGHHFWCATLPQRRRYTRLLLEQLAIRQARALCAVSQYAADVTRRTMHLGQRPIEILNNPIDTTLFVPRPESIVPSRIVFVGAITEKKGVRELCLSMTTVLRRHPGAELHLVGRDVAAPGGGLLREQLDGLLDAEVRRRIRFLGPLPQPQVSELMASAHVCVFPSHMETFGNVFAEAMACGRPVVVTRAGPGPEVLGPDGECGWLADPMDPEDIADKVCRVLDDRGMSQRCGANGRERAVRLFSVAASIDRNLTFYERLLGLPGA